MRYAALLAVLASLSATVHADAGGATLTGYPQILVETNEGEFVLEIEAERAPITAAHFVGLVRDGYFDGTIFHRVIAGFVVQGGGHRTDYSALSEPEPIVNESGNGLSNQRGTLAMARGDDPHSAAAQFYINVDDNSRLDPRPDRWGYAVFGRVYSGMEVVDAIASIPTGPGGPFAQDVPATPVVVRSMRLLSDEEIAARAAAELEAARKQLEALEDQ